MLPGYLQGIPDDTALVLEGDSTFNEWMWQNIYSGEAQKEYEREVDARLREYRDY